MHHTLVEVLVSRISCGREAVPSCSCLKLPLAPRNTSSEIIIMYDIKTDTRIMTPVRYIYATMY